MQLDEFFQYKNKLMEDLLTTDSIVELVQDEFEPKREAEELAYSQIFPYEYLPETAEEGRTYICFDVDIMRPTARSQGKIFYTPLLYVWVFTHKSKMRLPEGGVRVDELCSRICSKINGSRFYGMGELDLYSSKRFAPATDFQGKCLTFVAADVSKYNDHNRPVPVNRKQGI